jgi:hypothetical protein
MMKRQSAEVERDARIRSAFVDSTSVDYRARCNKGLGPQQLHAELNEMTFNNGKKLTARNIAYIVNYCYYRGDPTAIARITERAVFR